MKNKTRGAQLDALNGLLNILVKLGLKKCKQAVIEVNNYDHDYKIWIQCPNCLVEPYNECSCQ